MRSALLLALATAASALIVSPAQLAARPARAAPHCAVRMYGALDQAAVQLATTEFAGTTLLAALEDIWKTENRVVTSEVDVVGSSTTILGLAVVFPVAATIVCSRWGGRATDARRNSCEPLSMYWHHDY